MTRAEGMRWTMRPASGAPAGQLDAARREKGKMPSFASSWFSRLVEKVTLATLPKAEMATKALRISSMIDFGLARTGATPQDARGVRAKDLVEVERGDGRASALDLARRGGRKV